MGCGAINNKNTIKNSPIKILVLGFSGSGKNPYLLLVILRRATVYVESLRN